MVSERDIEQTLNNKISDGNQTEETTTSFNAARRRLDAWICAAID